MRYLSIVTSTFPKLAQSHRAFPLESGAVDCFCGARENQFHGNDDVPQRQTAAANILFLGNVGCEISASHNVLLFARLCYDNREIFCFLFGR